MLQQTCNESWYALRTKLNDVAPAGARDDTHDITQDHWHEFIYRGERVTKEWAQKEGLAGLAWLGQGLDFLLSWTAMEMCKQWQDAFHLHSKVHGTHKKKCISTHRTAALPPHDVTASASLRFLHRATNKHLGFRWQRTSTEPRTACRLAPEVPSAACARCESRALLLVVGAGDFFSWRRGVLRSRLSGAHSFQIC